MGEMPTRMRLWEVDHPYYCSEMNYYRSEGPTRFRSWHEFESDMGDSDLDLNLVFRWDWREGSEWGLPEYNGDDNYRNGLLMVFFMGQRKGLFWCAEVEVCRADEPAVIVFLQPRLNRLATMWLPLQSEPEKDDA